MICLLGGTFDPVHHGHLRTAIEVQQALGVDRVHLLPARIPPHRPRPVAAAERRLALLRRAIEGEPALAIDTRELERPGPSYMVDTLRSVRAEAPDRPVTLVIGLDAFAGLEGWHEWRAIPQLAHLLVLERPGGRWPAHGALADLTARAQVAECRALFDAPAGRVAGLRVSQLEISSTHIRDLLRTGRNARYLLPDGVLDLILQSGWYRDT